MTRSHLRLVEPYVINPKAPPPTPYAVENGHLPILAGETFEARRKPPRWLARAAGVLAFAAVVAVLLALR